jgi:hypothetical protein
MVAPAVLMTVPSADITCSGIAFPVGAFEGIVMLI